MKNEKVSNILNKLCERRHRSSQDYYKPLPEDESKIIREYYASMIDLPLGGAETKICNYCDTLIGNGYTRIVVGDYGPYMEFSEEQIVKDNITQRWPGKPKRPVRYIWMHTKDEKRTKIYWQQQTVEYADYRPGYYYMDILNAYEL